MKVFILFALLVAVSVADEVRDKRGLLLGTIGAAPLVAAPGVLGGAVVAPGVIAPGLIAPGIGLGHGLIAPNILI